MPPDTAYSVCPHDCPSACSLEIELLASARIGRVRGAEDNAYTAGVVCAKVARYAERVHHPDRLTEPLRRDGPKGSGAFRPISWDEALDEVASSLTRAAERHGPEAVWLYNYAGTMGLVQRDGLDRLRRAMGYSRQHSTICSTLMEAGLRAGIGARAGPDPREIGESSELVVVWGTNPVYTQVNLMHHIARARRERGARLVVVDPYRTATAAQADHHLMPRPGTDGALACAVMHVLFVEGLADRNYMARYTDAPAGLEAHLAGRTPAWAEAITGIRADEIVAFAREYGATKRAMIRMGYGFTRSRNGAVNLHAVSCLPAVTGAWAHPGGGAFGSLTDVFDIDMTLIMGLDIEAPKRRALDMSRLAPILEGDEDALRGGPPVTAMMVQNSNPAAVAPESGRVGAGFAREDLFLCVHEQFLTDTARFADIVLPATTFLEHDDLYTSYGQSFLQIGRRAIAPLGQCRSNHDVLAGLAKRLGARHPAFEMTAWELIDATLERSGQPSADELAARRWIDLRPEFGKAHFLDGFPTADGRFRFAPDWRSVGLDHAGLPALPDHAAIIDAADDERPFRLVTAPSRNYLNSSFTETPTSVRREGRPTAKIHPDDLSALGIAVGETVRIGNRRGEVVVHAEAFPGIGRGVVVVESVWPAAAFAGGVGINALTSADPGPPLGGAVFHDTAVWLAPVGEAQKDTGSAREEALSES